MSKKIKIRVKKPWIGYPGSFVQQNYAEDVTHGFIKWTIDDRESFDVSFKRLPNPHPYVTIEWQGDVESTLAQANSFENSSRFRIKSSCHISHHDVQKITNVLKRDFDAIEVTFKSDQTQNKEELASNALHLAHDDMRNPDVLLRLVKSFHKQTSHDDETWNNVYEQIKKYVSLVTKPDDVVRNTKWSLKRLKFDNTFAYGDGNVINFEKLNGVVGIFGQNRVGKSSIVGTIMYSLFNTTDRGSLKNLYACNIRKQYCYANAVIHANGSDYVLERQTTKHENKRGVVNAATALNLFKMVDDETLEDVAGEQRLDTEKTVRSLIGTSDDFFMTSLSAQGDNNQFVDHGSAKRWQVLSKFLDLDIIDKMSDLAGKDLNDIKTHLSRIPTRDWNKLADDYSKKLDELTTQFSEIDVQLAENNDELQTLRSQLMSHKDITPVTSTQVDSQREKVESLTSLLEKKTSQRSAISNEIETYQKKISDIETLKQQHDLEKLREQLKIIDDLRRSSNTLKLESEREATVLKQQERSLKILDDVPCGDQFPSCKFIKDAHVVKSKIDAQREKTLRFAEKFRASVESLSTLNEENTKKTFEKLTALIEHANKLNVMLSSKQLEFVKLDSEIPQLEKSLSIASLKLKSLEEALKNDENVEVVTLRTQIDDLLLSIKKLDATKLNIAAARGKVLSDIEKMLSEKKSRDLLLKEMTVYELIESALSRKGIPSVIIKSQLPLINIELTKILSGIVDFTVELEADSDTDAMDVFINYGDSRRIIELGSGMEKMISAIAIRVALVNVSSLPKTDIFVIDEGFGALDDAAIEACNRFLTSLKRYFKTIFVITHVDGIKDCADQVLEITKNEKDAKIVYE